MAVMSSNDRTDCTADFIRTQTGAGVAITKTQLRAAIDAADQWASDNAASFNSALPVAARNNLAAPQKARLLAWVVLKRHVAGA
jgi:hypothetical protein